MHFVQDEVASEWNGHRIRAGRNTRVLAGIPDQLFLLPPAGILF